MNHILIKFYDNGQLKVRYQAEYHMHPQNVFYPKNDYADNYGPWRNPNCPDPNQSINQSLIPNGKRYSNLQFLFHQFTGTMGLIV